MQEEKLVISVPEAGRLLGVSRPTAYALAKNGTLPTIRLGRKLVVPMVQFERMLSGQCPQSPGSHASKHLTYDATTWELREHH